ncbi:MAG TPA: DUF1553 domain-containing protein [Planctomycetota bacterium]|nr:DUF1553 domain-containing protein [Planctomycetota bacterium]
MRGHRRSRLGVAILFLAGASLFANEQPHPKPAPIPETIDFNRDVRPIISAKCYHCHGPDKGTRKAKLRLDTREGATADLDGNQAIVPGNLAKSEAWRRMNSKDPEEVMPPPANHEKLSPRDIAVLKKWIEQGAVYAEHWSFVKPVKFPLPKVAKAAWPKNGIDHFILARLEQEKLAPSPEADRYALIRRVSLDLTGLPPTPQEVDAFIADTSADAYGKVVDRLLASPAYGERWARMWLDLARYADSAGYGSDPLRLNIWPYRDWLIGAFNKNLPYDQFVTEQLAGDLLPNATQDQILATAFHRNTMTNTEGGTDDEEFRVAAVKDRANTTGQVFMGLTVGCAQCHSHKFDPISQKEYYQLYAFFNQSEDSDRGDEFPTMPLPTQSEREKTEKIKATIAELEAKLKGTSPELQQELAAWEKEASQIPEINWQVLEPHEFTSAGLTHFEKMPDNSLFGSGNSPASDFYDIKWRTNKKITALRMELLPDERLPKGGPGRAPDSGDVAITEIQAYVRPVGTPTRKARFVRVELPGEGKFLHIAEVQVFSGGQNIATKGKATQSSTDYDGPPHLAIDGNTNGDYGGKSVTHTKQEKNPWWEVDLGSEHPIDEIVFFSRTDGGLHTRLDGMKILALDNARKNVAEQTLAKAPEKSEKVPMNTWTPVGIINASSTVAGSDATRAIDNDKNTSWLSTNHAGKASSLAFELGATIPLEGTYELRLTINQAQDVKGQKTIGRFRLLATEQPRPVRVFPAAIRSILTTAADKRTDAQKTELLDYFRPYAKVLGTVRADIAKRQKELSEIKPPSVPIMRELPANKRRATKILNKGNFLTPGDPVEAAVLEQFHRLPDGAAANRLGLAQWIVSRENPLTARVAVNRFWAQIFGTGIVETEEDFGTQGTLPTHPELLDWMAVEFMDMKWDMKAFLKLIVTSATYRQSSKVTPALLEKDPRNRLLTRSPRLRLDAEQVRDQALALSGLLSHKIGGPSVFPPQPEGLWRAAFNGERTWSTSQGEDKYRRGMYTFWRRTVPYPSMATFDAPSREICNIRRIATNTPLQAFVTLNDPVYVECAQSLARRLVAEGGATPEERVKFGLKLVLARVPVDEQVKSLVTLYQSELESYKKNADAAKKMATMPLGPAPAGMNEAELAAWTVVANILLNLDGVLMKG